MSEAPPPALADQVKELIQLISNENLIAQELIAMSFDVKRLPIDQLTKNQISRGYAILQRISTDLERIQELETPPVATTTRATRSNKSGIAAASRTDQASSRSPGKKNAAAIAKLKDAIKDHSSEFYTLFPHDFAPYEPPAILDLERVKQKIRLLEVLTGVEVSQTLERERVKAGGDGGEDTIMAQYKLLNAELESLPETQEEYKLIERYVETTSAPAGYKLKINSIVKITRPNEGEMHEIFQQTGNHQLLWYGARLSKAAEIISQGLQFAPSNDYIFGKSISLTDSLAEASNRCFASPSQPKPKGVLFLVEAALGRQYRVTEAEILSWAELQTDKQSDSLLGFGRMAADQQFHETMQDGVVVPLGQVAARDHETQFFYNEFVVYRPEQLKLRYVVSLDFHYSHWSTFITPSAPLVC